MCLRAARTSTYVSTFAFFDLQFGNDCPKHFVCLSTQINRSEWSDKQIKIPVGEVDR